MLAVAVVAHIERVVQTALHQVVVLVVVEMVVPLVLVLQIPENWEA